MKKSLIMMLVLSLLVLAAVPVLAGNGQNMRENSVGIEQGTTRAYIGELLVLDADAMREARKAGMSMIAIAERTGMAKETFLNAVTEFRKERVSAAVAEGLITAEQAEQCETTMGSRIRENMERIPQPRLERIEKQLQTRRGNR